jgi:hypothetical protein
MFALVASLRLCVSACLLLWGDASLPSARGAKPRFSQADHDRRVAELKKKLPGPEFTIIVQRPFVVVGDERPEEVRRHCRQTIQWAVDHLKAAYFPNDPSEILDIWLFRDAESYEKNCRALFKHAPSTPFGFYSEEDRALVMNIATGGGTLVHEIVHPFMAANFPDCPAWFNEGLGSLYEQSSERDGRIVGLTNWRLAGLQTAIRNKRLGSFERLCTMTDRDFYRDNRGTNYAQARYLCYYLQEKGLLQPFYRQFLANHSKDRGGYRTLRNVLRRDDMENFQKEWEAFVLQLTFPEGRARKPATIDDDPQCIAKLRDYRSLIPLAQEARKPMFFLKPADGALGAHTYAVAEAYKDFRTVAEKIAKKARIKAK